MSRKPDDPTEKSGGTQPERTDKDPTPSAGIDPALWENDPIWVDIPESQTDEDIANLAEDLGMTVEELENPMQNEDKQGVIKARCFVPTNGPESWKPLLAEPEKQWKRGYSARTLAHSWEAADGLPPEINDLFIATPELSDVPPELLIALPEYKVPLPGGRTESQNDVFSIISGSVGLMTMMVEGKVNEAFGPTIESWFQDPSKGKRERLSYICGLLGLENDPPGHIRYQLLHRTASAVIERGRFSAAAAVMVVHSFSQEKRWYGDYEAFCDLLGVTAHPDCLVRHDLPDGYPLFLGWATGASEHLEA